MFMTTHRFSENKVNLRWDICTRLDDTFAHLPLGMNDGESPPFSIKNSHDQSGPIVAHRFIDGLPEKP